jgi:hypothetical protein
MPWPSDMKPKYSSAYWRELADDARARADEMASIRARLCMIGIAGLYDQLADEAKFEGRPGVQWTRALSESS